MPTVVEKKLRQSDCFKLLAACFYEPDREMFLQERLCDNLVSLFSSCGYVPAAEAARTMLVALSELSDDELKVEYARLFVGPFELVAPPYGSVYLEEKKRLMGDSTVAVQKMYQEAGLSLDVKEAPDHIALELEFMHYLCLAESEAGAKRQRKEAQRLNKMQTEFMTRLLGPWIPPFCENIRQGTDNGFYLNLADCLEGFIQEIILLHHPVS
ncbi:MAG: molecular chaperone TorD family protein [Desulfobulbaceae bacterium]|nr:molecular chaperone TorD family protein [Desulfobulbaceae bacterium]